MHDCRVCFSVSLVQTRYENIPAVLKYAIFGSGPLTVLGGVEVSVLLPLTVLGGVEVSVLLPLAVLEGVEVYSFVSHDCPLRRRF